MESSDIIATGNGPAEVEESDSGDSVFFTQKPQKCAPNAATSPRCSIRSKPLSPRFLESGSSENEDEDPPEKAKRHPCLPKYNFNFLNQKKSLPEHVSTHSTRSRAIHYSAVAGFFSCFGEMWPKGQSRKSLETTLPTVDADNEEITPVTEDEKSDEEDVKIIDKRQFLYSLKSKITKSSQPWFKMAQTAKPTRKSVSKQHFGTNKTLQATPSSNKPEALSNDEHQDSSDATLIEVYESITPRSLENDAHKYTANLTHENQVRDNGNGMSALDKSDTESQSILQNSPLDISGRHCENIYNTNLSTKRNRGDKLKNKNMLLSQESVDLFEDHITKYPSPRRRKNKTPRKTNGNVITKDNDDIADNLETTLMTKCVPQSCDLKKDVQGQSLHEDTVLLSGPNVEDHDDGIVQKKKKKKRKKEHKMLDDGQMDNIPAVDKVVSDMSEGLKKHKKNRKAAHDCDEDVALKNCSLGLVESQENYELVNNDSSTGFVTIQEESVSVRKKKRKKHVPFVAETAENIALHVSLSGEGHGADKSGFSTNYIESAETNGPLHETELGNKVKNKKRKENGELTNAGTNAKVTEIRNMNRCNKSKDWGCTEVIQTTSDESDHIKKKASQIIEKTAPEGVEGNAIISPNASEWSERKKKKKKRQYCDGGEMELEHSAVKRKKHKKISFDNQDDIQIVTPSHVEILPSSGRVKESKRTKGKKRLYNPNETFMD